MGAPAIAGAVAILAFATLLIIGMVALTTREPAAPAARPGGRVDVVGDSLVHQSATPLREKLAAAGFDATVVGLPAQGLSSEGIRVRLDEVAQDRAAVLVVATTTNDVHENAQVDSARMSAPAYREKITALLHRFKDRCVVIVNARDRTHALYLPERAVVLNAELSRLELENSNMVLVDWAERSRDLPGEWFSQDQLHFGADAGQVDPGSRSAREYAAAILDGVIRCAGRGG